MELNLFRADIIKPYQQAVMFFFLQVKVVMCSTSSKSEVAEPEKKRGNGEGASLVARLNRVHREGGLVWFLRILEIVIF